MTNRSQIPFQFMAKKKKTKQMLFTKYVFRHLKEHNTNYVIRVLEFDDRMSKIDGTYSTDLCPYESGMK